MKPAAPLPAACAVLATAAIAGCSTGVSEARVQAMIDKAIAQQLAKQEAAGAPAPVEAAEPASAYASEVTGPAFESAPNAAVDNQLNNADMAFRKGWSDNGCMAVTYAISSASMGGVSEDQSRQLKSYAARCNLRY